MQSYVYHRSKALEIKCGWNANSALLIVFKSKHAKKACQPVHVGVRHGFSPGEFF